MNRHWQRVREKAIPIAGSTRPELRCPDKNIFNMQFYFPCQGHGATIEGKGGGAAQDEDDDNETAADADTDMDHNHIDTT